MENKLDAYLATIPEPGTIRDRLSKTLEEAKLLRKLLKLAESKKSVRDCERGKGEGPDA